MSDERERVIAAIDSLIAVTRANGRGRRCNYRTAPRRRVARTALS